MKHRGRLLTTLMVIGLLTSVVLPSVNAEVFDIGTKVSESHQDLRDRKMVYFDSGSSVYIEPDYIDYITPILDGNVSTGLDHDFGPGHSSMFLEVVFPYSINVSDITIKPDFGGGTTNYTLYLNSNGIWSPWFAQKNSTEETFQINCLITGVWLDLDTDGTNHYYFNDIIINYTPGFENLSVIQDQFNDLSQQIDILNNVINDLNLTQSEIIENVTNLRVTYDQLNTSLVDLNNEFANLDSQVFNLEAKNILLEQKIDNLTSEIADLTLELENFGIRLTQLESENTELKNDIIVLKSENSVIHNELDNLTKEIEDLKDTREEPDNTVAFGALIIGILGTLIALVAIILASRKPKGQNLKTEKKSAEDPHSTENESNDDT